MSVIILQPSIPHYRLDFFNSLSTIYGESFCVKFAHETSSIHIPIDFDWAHTTGPIRKILPGLYWQEGVIGICLHRNDVVVVSGDPRCLSNIALLIKARLAGAKTVWWGHYWSSTSKPWRFALRLLIMRLSNSLLFYTDQEVVEYKNRLGKNAKQHVYALNNGLNTKSIYHFRNDYDAELRPMNLLFIGRLTEKSNIGLLIQALAKPILCEVFLHVIGDGEEHERILQLVESLGISSKVIIHGAITDEAVISKIANQCRVFVYPGEVGLSLIHGMAYGLPAVVHSDRWRHMPEIAAFQAGITGEFFEPNNASSLADSISDILNDVDKLNYYSRECIRITSSSFNSSDMARRFSNFIKSL